MYVLIPNQDIVSADALPNVLYSSEKVAESTMAGILEKQDITYTIRNEGFSKVFVDAQGDELGFILQR